MSLELEILPTGEIKFPRSCTKEEQEIIINIFSTFVSKDKIEEIKKFFEENNNRKLILGKEILCG